MKIILLQDVPKIGKKYDVKNVADGYARNFLFPKKMAEIATEETIKNIEKRKNEIKKRVDDLQSALEKAAKAMDGKEYHFYVETGEKSEVFGSTSKKDIKETIEKDLEGFVTENLKKEAIERVKINLPRSLKTLGSHDIAVELGSNKIKIKAVINQVKI